MLVMVRDNGRNAAPAGRVTRIASVTATTVAAAEAMVTSARWLSDSDKSEARV